MEYLNIVLIIIGIAITSLNIRWIVRDINVQRKRDVELKEYLASLRNK